MPFSAGQIVQMRYHGEVDRPVLVRFRIPSIRCKVNLEVRINGPIRVLQGNHALDPVDQVMKLSSIILSHCGKSSTIRPPLSAMFKFALWCQNREHAIEVSSVQIVEVADREFACPYLGKLWG